ncbi:unnamed protein product [Phytomonas sp. Hart1]|nr:unnamed protein product [Phytomonas sp. Hart1]|eukprot:CCW71495.1 unnamed protein product [Phytomonas sp. isolate Hart1]
MSSDESSSSRTESNSLFGYISSSRESNTFFLSPLSEDESIDAVFSSKSIPVVKKLMKRLLKTSSMLKTSKERLDNFQHGNDSGGELFMNESDNLSKSLNLYHFLWGRLLFILHDEHGKCSDSYSNSLNLQDRIPFESLAHTIHHNNEFCDVLGEITSRSFEQQTDSDEVLNDPYRAILKEFQQKMTQIQLNATFCALFVVEGSREHYLDPVSVDDLCSSVIKETSRRNRLVPLSLMFSMFDQDVLAINDALTCGTLSVLLQRFRHLVHRLFGQFSERKMNEESNRHEDSSVNQQHNAVVIHSEANSRKGSQRASSSVPRSSLPDGLHLPNLAVKTVHISKLADNEVVQDSPLPVTSSINGTSAEADPFSTRFPNVKRNRERGDSPMLKKSKWFEQDNSTLLSLSSWHPCIADKVGRGPGWCYSKQGNGCDYGEIVGLTVDDEVIVRWVTSIDVSHEEAGRLFRYKYPPPFLEVVPWDDYLQMYTMNIDNSMLYLTEFTLTCAVLGVLCQQHETVLPVLQFQTIESAVHAIQSMDLAESKRSLENSMESLKQNETVLINHNNSITKEINSSDILLNWCPSMRNAKQNYREQREVVARIGWVLNALLMHKKLALFFLAHGGPSQILRIINGPLDMSTVYGCCIVLSQISKTSVFEEVLRNYREFFHPIMTFIIDQWKSNSSTDVQESAGAFLLNCLSFPCALEFFDNHGGGTLLMDTIENLLKMSEERFDVVFPVLQLVVLKCLNTYLIAHLMLSTKVLFRKHRVLSSMITKASPQTALPRDLGIIDSILFFFASPTPTLPDVSIENVLSLLVPDHLPTLKKVVDEGLHRTLLRCIKFYLAQSAWEPLAVALQVLRVLTVIPFVRPLVIEPYANESGISELLLIVKALHVSSQDRNCTREYHLLPCTVSALQVLLHLLTPPRDGADEAALRGFTHVCGDFRAANGVRTLFDLLRLSKDATFAAKLHLFPVVARVVQLMGVLRRYGDTRLLLDSLGVHREAQDLLQGYASVQREATARLGPRRLLGVEGDPVGRFMEHVKALLPGTAGGDGGGGGDGARLHHGDPLEMERRSRIIAHATIDYARESLLALIANHLEMEEGGAAAARVLRAEAKLPAPTPHASGDPAITLDGIIRTYLRQQQEKCPNPIETLPQFDLTKKHVYVPLPHPAEESRNVVNRLLDRKLGTTPSLRANVYTNRLIYQCPAFIFNITGGDEGLQGESICFCDGGNTLMIGTSEGALAFFDTFPEEENRDKLLGQLILFDEDGVASLEVSDNELLVAAVSKSFKVKIMARQTLPAVKQELENCCAIRFSHDNQFLLATSSHEQGCRLYDLETQQEMQSFVDRNWAGENINTPAVFDYYSSLILHDAVLWDLRCSRKPVFRFDRITESSASTFHPSNQMVLIDEKVWDLRSFRMVQTVPVFRKTTSFHMNQLGKVIYSFRQATSHSYGSTSIVSAVDSYSFEVIFSEETNPPFETFVLDPSDRYCAAILLEDQQSVVRVFSTSSGPYPSLTGFASPRPQQQESESDFEDEVSSDLSSSYSNYEVYDDEDGNEESSASYSIENAQEDDEEGSERENEEWNTSDSEARSLHNRERGATSEVSSSMANSEQST